MSRSRAAQALVVAAGLVPAAVLLADALRDRLGANPIETITHRTGDWTIWLLLGTLAVTPLVRLSGWGALIRFRRTLGLLAFSYGCLHLLTYVLLDRELLFDAALALSSVGEDIAKRPYITVGFTAFLLLVPLAVTSTKRWVRRLGGKRWNALHRLIYMAAALGILHYLWLVKGDQPKPVYHGLVLIGLLLLRTRWPLALARRLFAVRRGRPLYGSPAAHPPVRPAPAQQPDPA